MSDSPHIPGTAVIPYATPGALERVENRDRDERVQLEKRLDKNLAAEVALINEKLTGIKNLYEKQLELDHRALEIAQTAIGEHLHQLNNSEARALELRNATVQVVAFEEYKHTQATAQAGDAKEHQAWKETVMVTLAAQAASAKTWMVAIGLFVSLLSFALRFWTPGK